MNTRDKHGFTLVELIIAVAIIGILVAIAVQQYLAFQRRTNDLIALAQLKDMAAAQEAFFADRGRYTTVLVDLRNYGFTPDPKVRRTRSLINKSGAPSATAYQLTTKHDSGTGKIYLWMSDNGGLQ